MKSITVGKLAVCLVLDTALATIAGNNPTLNWYLGVVAGVVNALILRDM